MIIFDGVDIQSVANVKIEDIRVSPVEIVPTIRTRPIAPGSFFVRNAFGSRTVSITFAIQTENKVARHEALMAVSAWAKTDKEYKLLLPGYPNFYLMAVCTGKPEPSMRQWWESKLRLTFSCFDNPFWNSIIEKTAACGSSFFVAGDAPPLMQITRTLSAAASDQTYSHSGQSMTFSTIPAGSLVIDLNKQLATVNNVSIMQYYSARSRFLEPRIGTENISGTGTVVYRERWQ